MKQISELCALLLLVLIITGCSGQSNTVLAGEKAPFTRFLLLDGNFKTTENYKGKNLLLVFWATTCPHSQSVMEDVASWERQYGRKYNVKSVAINIDKSSKEDRVKEVYSNPALSYIEHAYSGNDIYDEAYIAYDVGETPTLVLIDPYGKIIGSGDTMDVLRDAFPNS